MRYKVRKEVEYGCTIFSVYNTETNTRVNYFATTEEAQAFAERQEGAALVYEQEQRRKADEMFPNSYTEQEAELVASNID